MQPQCYLFIVFFIRFVNLIPYTYTLYEKWVPVVIIFIDIDQLLVSLPAILPCLDEKNAPATTFPFFPSRALFLNAGHQGADLVFRVNLQNLRQHKIFQFDFQ